MSGDPLGRAPDGITPLDGYRVFHLDVQRMELRSPARDFAWKPRVTEAVCLDMRYARQIAASSRRHLAPDESCACGLYAMKELSATAMSLALSGHRGWSERFEIMARVKLWGKVIEATDGYRAQFGMVSIIYVPPEVADGARVLAEVYGCSVVELEPAQRLIGGPLDGRALPVRAQSEGDLVRIPCGDQRTIWWWAIRTQSRRGLAQAYQWALPNASKSDARIIQLRFGLQGRPWKQEEVAAITGVELSYVRAIEAMAIAGLRRLEEQHPKGCTGLAVYRLALDETYRFEGLRGRCPLWSSPKRWLSLSR